VGAAVHVPAECPRSFPHRTPRQPPSTGQVLGNPGEFVADLLDGERSARHDRKCSKLAAVVLTLVMQRARTADVMIITFGQFNKWEGKWRVK